MPSPASRFMSAIVNSRPARALVPVVMPHVAAPIAAINFASSICPSQRINVACPNGNGGFLYLPEGTVSCSVGANLGGYCYKGAVGQKVGTDTTEVLEGKHMSEAACEIAACGGTSFAMNATTGDLKCTPLPVLPDGCSAMGAAGSNIDIGSSCYNYYMQMSQPRYGELAVTVTLSGGHAPYVVMVSTNNGQTNQMRTTSESSITIPIEVPPNTPITVSAYDTGGMPTGKTMSFNSGSCSAEAGPGCDGVNYRAHVIYEDAIQRGLDQQAAAREADVVISELCGQAGPTCVSTHYPGSGAVNKCYDARIGMSGSVYSSFGIRPATAPALKVIKR